MPQRYSYAVIVLLIVYGTTLFACSFGIQIQTAVPLSYVRSLLVVPVVSLTQPDLPLPPRPPLADKRAIKAWESQRAGRNAITALEQMQSPPLRMRFQRASLSFEVSHSSMTFRPPSMTTI